MSGPDAKRAMGHLLQAGITPDQVAAEVGVTTRTARRWAAGTQHPNARNLAALKSWVGDVQHNNAMAPYMDWALDRATLAAGEALETEAEAAQRAELVARYWRDRPSPAPQPEPARRSITYDVDPFTLLADSVAGALPEVLFA